MYRFGLASRRVAVSSSRLFSNANAVRGDAGISKLTAGVALVTAAAFTSIWHDDGVSSCFHAGGI